MNNIGLKTIVVLAREWTYAKNDILNGRRSPGDERAFLMNVNNTVHDRFISALNMRSEELYKWFNCTSAEFTDIVLDYKLYRDAVLNKDTDVTTHIRRWYIVYPGAFDGLWDVTDVDTLDSIEELLTNVISGVLLTRRIITA